jgi:hypothetical protein
MRAAHTATKRDSATGEQNCGVVQLRNSFAPVFLDAFEIQKRNLAVLVVAAFLYDLLGLISPLIVIVWFTMPIGWLIVASAYAQIIESGKLPLSEEELQGAVPPLRPTQDW